MAGIDLTGPRRSELLSALLQKQLQPQQNIRSGGELGARLLAQLLQQKKIDKLQGQEATEERVSNEKLSRAMLGEQVGTAPAKSVTLQGFDDQSAQEVNIPGKRGLNLDPAQISALQDFKQGQKELNSPTVAEEIELRLKADQKIQGQRDAAALERQELAAMAAETRQEKMIEANASLADKKILAQETSDVRQIQARFSLERLKADIDKEASTNAGWEPTEQQAKATGWYTSAVAGESVLKQYIDSGYVPSINALSLYAKSVDPDTGAAMRVQLRRAISQKDLNFLDATNMIVDPVVRNRTGAAVRTDEFITTFNSIIPLSKEEMENKSFFRHALIDAMGEIAGQGRNVGDAIVSKHGTPKQQLDELGGQKLTEEQEAMVSKWIK